MARPLPASALFGAPRSHACTNAAAFARLVHFGHVWRRSSRERGAAAPVSSLENRPRCTLQDWLWGCMHPRARPAAAAPQSARAQTITHGRRGRWGVGGDKARQGWTRRGRVGRARFTAVIAVPFQVSPTRSRPGPRSLARPRRPTRMYPICARARPLYRRPPAAQN